MNQEELLRLIDKAAEDRREKLDLSHKKLTELPEEIGKLKNLKMLDLSHNQIRDLPDTISNLKNLTSLNLDSNQINEISDVFSKVENLEVLILNNNQISKISDVIAELKNLESLILNNNYIKEIPNAIFELKNLRDLHFSGNKISKIPDAIAELNNLIFLDFLDLNDNQISRISSEIAEFKNLTTLYLGSNQISEISDAISKLENLEVLYLSNNQISLIPGAISELKKLTELYLSNNQISLIPGAISELKKLTELDLSYNQISLIPDTISELKKLKSLDLSYNQIREIPETIIQLKNLESDPDDIGIGIEGNPLINPPYEIAEKGIDAIHIYFLNQQLSRYKDDDGLKIERSIEFPPEYWTAGTSILSYFSHILNVKYPDQNIKVRIEQEGLLLRIIIDTPEGQTETIEKAFNDYLMVISRQIPPESLLDSRKEIEALERKLEIAELELKLERRHLTKAIESLEIQMSQFYGLFGKLIENLPHNPLYMNQFTNNNPNANIANLVNQNQDTAKVISSNFSQNQGTNTAELLQLIANLRQTAAQFPSDLQAGVMVDLEEVETEIQKPENQRNLPKLKMRLIALFTAASLMGGAIANITDFTNNITDLATKAGIELKLPATFP